MKKRKTHHDKLKKQAKGINKLKAELDLYKTNCVELEQQLSDEMIKNIRINNEIASVYEHLNSILDM